MKVEAVIVNVIISIKPVIFLELVSLLWFHSFPGRAFLASGTASMQRLYTIRDKNLTSCFHCMQESDSASLPEC